jgi:glycosyltransferase involved in cell wall biosynthesis
MSLFDRPGGTRRIAVVPAYNEEPSVADVLGKLSHLVDELVVVDDGSTDGTRAEIEAWLPGHDHCHLLTLDENQGMSAAYHLAFTDLRRRLAAGELDSDDLVFTVDADGQHDLDVLDDLHRQTVEQDLDALLVQRDLSTYPRYKQVGNRLLSAWATLWAGGVRLRDVESGYRIFRLGPLVDALDYYQGRRYSETVEVAVVMSRLRYAVRNDVLVPVPVYRSRTRMRDVAVDLAAIPTAAFRVTLRRQKHRPVPSLVPPTAVTLGLAVVPTLLAGRLVRSALRRRG